MALRILTVGVLVAVLGILVRLPVIQAQIPSSELSPISDKHCYSVTNQEFLDSNYSYTFYDQSDSMVHNFVDIIPAMDTRVYNISDISGVPSGYTGRLVIDSDNPFTSSFVLCPDDIAIDKIGPRNVAGGDLITYTLTITNSGAITANNLVVTDTIPDNANYVSGDGANVGGVVSWTVATLAPNEQTTQVTFSVTATENITNSDYGVTTDGIVTMGNSVIETIVHDGVAVPSSGGTISPTTGVNLSFDSGVFTESVVIDYSSQPITDTDELEHVGVFYELNAISLSSGNQVQPGTYYTISVIYRQEDVPVGVDETLLALYYHDGSQWVKEPTSIVDVDANLITAWPDHFSLWAVLAEDQRYIYLPVIVK